VRSSLNTFANRALLPTAWYRAVTATLLCVAAVFFALAFVHLRADFPNGSAWNDWSKTTDEGWYTSGAVHRALTGNWHQPGAFNPAVALPVWPALAGVWFRLAGFGMVQIRVLALLITGVSLLMLFRLVRQSAGALPAAVAIALLTVNPFFYSFTRLAVLEPVMIFFLLLALVLAAEAVRRDSFTFTCAVGVTITLLVLTKTTGLVLAPGILYFLWAGLRQRGVPVTAAVGRVAGAMAAAVMVWALYYGLVIRRYLPDYRLLFHINQDRVHLSIVPLVGWHTLRDGMWIDSLLYPLAIAAVIAAAVWLRELWREPLFASSVLTAVGYLAFIGYHSNLQPRYYLLLAPSVVIVLALTLKHLAARAAEGGKQWRATLIAYAFLLGISLPWMALGTLGFAVHPQYTFLTAANGFASAVAAEQEAHRLVIGNQGDELSLWTGIPAICAEYSTDPPAAVVQRYAPGWYVEILGGKLSAMRQQLQSTYRMQERARYEIFDDPERHTFVLYRLLPR
jgi:4-amino-4-deoxy-L-arabinose transferase-like glycosyltransferase